MPKNNARKITDKSDAATTAKKFLMVGPKTKATKL